MVNCWPEIAFPFAELSRFRGQPGYLHLDALHHVLRYVNGHREQGYLVFPTKLPAEVTAFCDASFAPDRVDFRSTSGQVVFVGDTPVLWSARRSMSDSDDLLARSFVNAIARVFDIGPDITQTRLALVLQPRRREPPTLRFSRNTVHQAPFSLGLPEPEVVSPRC
jgi:hypothetical protein